MGVLFAGAVWWLQQPLELKTQPVDPRDLLRGDYVRLGYEISSIDVAQLPAGETIRRHDPVYVTLGKGGDATWQPLAFSRTQPTAPLAAPAVPAAMSRTMSSGSA